MSPSRLLPVLFPALVIAAGCGGSPAPTGAATQPLACSIPASCPAADDECLGAVDNAGKTRFGLRISRLAVTQPAGLAAGIVGTVLDDDVLPANVACNLPGAGTFSWLLRFDLAAGTLETGGARPVADPAQGYSFAREELLGWTLRPTSFPLAMDAAGGFSTPAAADLNLPLYIGCAATSAVVIPLRGARFTAGTLSSSQNCVGRYDLAALRPADDCFPVEGTPAFRTGGSVTGVVLLEDADRVLLPAFSETLCARLAGDDGAFVERDAVGSRSCKRDAAGAVLFRGDTCSTPGGACGDAVTLAADFAASSVRIED